MKSVDYFKIILQLNVILDLIGQLEENKSGGKYEFRGNSYYSARTHILH